MARLLFPVLSPPRSSRPPHVSTPCQFLSWQLACRKLHNVWGQPKSGIKFFPLHMLHCEVECFLLGSFFCLVLLSQSEERRGREGEAYFFCWFCCLDALASDCFSLVDATLAAGLNCGDPGQEDSGLSCCACAALRRQ